MSGTALQAQEPLLAAPSIKGIFVNSHVRALRKQLGDQGLHRLEEHLGGPVGFGAAEDVPTATESRLIEAAAGLLAPCTPPEDLALEAGRLHFRNFTGTPWARLLFTMFPRDFAFMLRHATGIAERVFQNVRFSIQELEPCIFRVTVTNSGYPLDHFRGLFEEWMEQFGCTGSVVAQQAAPTVQEYLIQWT